MKSSLSLKAAVAGALGLVGASAFALDPNDIDSSVVRLYVSGATATDNAFDNLGKLSSGELCQAGTLDIYYGSKTKVLFCRAGFTSGAISAGVTKIAVFKESGGGSANGIAHVGAHTAVITATSTLSYIDFDSSSVSAGCAVTTAAPADAPFAAYDVRSCTAAPTVAVAPDAGISDIDPATFLNVGGASSGVTSAHVSAIGANARKAVSVTFNPIISTELFEALQAKQGLSGLTAVDQIPSLSASIIRGIFTGVIVDGSQIYTRSATAAVASALPAGQIYVCRRGNTSGTMASFKLQYLNQGCTKNAGTTSAFVTPAGAGGTSNENTGSTWSDATFGGQTVFAGSGSGDVRKCVSYHSKNNQYAIGVASTERLPKVGDTDVEDSFRYVKVDGQEPTLKAVMEGRYDFFTENSFNHVAAFLPSGAKKSIWDQIYNKIGTSSVLAKVNDAWLNAAAISGAGAGEADTGLLDLPNLDISYGPAFPVTNANVRSTPINSQTRTALDAGSNNCNRTFQIFPQ